MWKQIHVDTEGSKMHLSLRSFLEERFQVKKLKEKRNLLGKSIKERPVRVSSKQEADCPGHVSAPVKWCWCWAKEKWLF